MEARRGRVSNYSAISERPRAREASWKAHLAFALLGCSTLAFFNAAITVMNYFSQKFPEMSFGVYGTASYTTWLFVALAIMFFLGGSIRGSLKRTFFFFYVCLAAMHGTLMLSTETGGKVGFYIACASMGLGGLFTGFLQSLLLQISSSVADVQCVINLLFGQSLAGVACLAFGCVLMVTNNDAGVSRAAAYILIGTSGIAMLGCIFLYNVLERDEIVAGALEGKGETQEGAAGFGKMWITIRRAALHVVGLALVFVCTFAAFPSSLQTLESKTDRISTAVIQVLVTGAFQIGDMVGRYLPKINTLRLGEYYLFVAVVARFALLPALYRVFATPVIHMGTFGIQISLMLMLSITNGWFSTLHCINGPEKVQDADRGICGRLMALSLVFGIMIGSWIAPFSQRLLG